MNDPKLFDISTALPAMTGPAGQVGKALGVDGAKLAGLDEAELESIARDFEGVLLHKLMDSMGETVGEGLFDDSGTKQVQGMFWQFLSKDVGEKGGAGLWKEIYQDLRRMAKLRGLDEYTSAKSTDDASVEHLR
jgi:Rod binding domain-containing protein